MGDFTITQQPSSKNLYLYPTGNGCDTNTYPFGDSPQWDCVSEEHDSLTDDDYVFQDGAAVISDLYQIDDHTTETGTINYVQARCRAKSDKFPPAHDAVYKVMIAQNSGCSDFAQSDNLPINTTFTTFRESWDENPFTDAAWTWANVDDLQVGFEMSSPSVTASPYAMIPVQAGDRTDIDSVTTGYEHWEAVQADRPLSQVEESGAAWAYDLYDFIENDTAYYTSDCRACCKFGDYVLVTDSVNNKTYIYKWYSDGRVQYLDDVDYGGATIDSDGTYYYVGDFDYIYSLEFNSSTNTLSLKSSYNDADIDGQDVVYHDGYVYLAAGIAGLFIFSVSNGTLTLVDNSITDTVYGVAYDTDNDYIFISNSTDMEIQAYSFDGTTLTLLDEIAVGDMERGLDFGDGYLYFPADAQGLKVYSFDGTTLTLEDTLDNGGNYSRVAYCGGYIHVLDLNVGGNGMRAYSFDGASLTHEGTYADAGYYNVCSNGDFICGQDAANEAQLYVFDGSNYKVVCTVSDGMTPKYLDDNIESVTVVLKMGKEYDADDEADIRGRATIKTHATEYTSDYVTLEYPKRWYAFTWETNPNTSAAWTLAEVQAMQAGVGLYGDGSKYAACSVCQLVIASSTSVSPEFHTSRLHLKINYDPPEESISLSKPSNWERSHDRITKIINFWSGNREVYDLSRGGKKVLLRGTEYSSDNSYNPCNRIQNLITMAERGDTITLSDTGFCALNDEFRILSFGWDLVGEKPVAYKWMLELEFAE